MDVGLRTKFDDKKDSGKGVKWVGRRALDMDNSWRVQALFPSQLSSKTEIWFNEACK